MQIVIMPRGGGGSFVEDWMELMIHRRSDECNSDEISGNNFISSGKTAEWVLWFHFHFAIIKFMCFLFVLWWDRHGQKEKKRPNFLIYIPLYPRNWMIGGDKVGWFII